MKKTLKERITALGLSYTKEMSILFLIIFVIAGAAILAILLLKELYIGIIAFAIGVVSVYVYLSRYSSLEQKQQRDNVDQLIALLSYFEIFISNGHNVYTSFQMLLPYAETYLSDAISTMLYAIDTDKTVGPYITFASKFNDRIVESLMLSIYQMVDNGESEIELSEFDILFTNIKEKHKEELIERKKKSLDLFNSLPLIGAGAVTIVLSLSIISIIGDYINVI